MRNDDWISKMENESKDTEFRNNVKEAIREMFNRGEIEVNIEKEYKYYDSDRDTYVVQVKIDREVVHTSYAW